MPSVGIFSLDPFGFTGMATFDSAVADIEYDMDTGDLYALYFLERAFAMNSEDYIEFGGQIRMIYRRAHSI
jgi:hypothetical protein